MKRGKKSEAVDGEIHLHEAIIQQIQSFLSCKEAAKTSILSKTWYNAWANRPVVDLDQRHFQSRGGADGFLEYSKNVMRRYEQSYLKIESFRFCMEHVETHSFPLVNKLIVDAMKLGACDLNVEFTPGNTKFDLPHEVLRSESVVRLSVSGCRIDLEATVWKFGFPKLKSLSLCRVCLVEISLFDIISCCPLIEEFVLSKCSTIRVSNGRVKRNLVSEKQCLGSIIDAPIRQYNYLKSLYLHMILIDKFLFNDMSINFPCLKDLTLDNCNPFKGIKIYSPSLEFLTIVQRKVVVSRFDFPSLRKFTFSGTCVPFLSFEASSREWESDISITHLEHYVRSRWLERLKNFLMKLSLSKISLSLCFGILAVKRFDNVEPAPCLPKPEVENLMLWTDAPTSVCSSLLKDVFWTCRPKFITLDLQPELCIGREEKSNMAKLMCRTLIEEESESCCIPSRHMSDMYGLEKVDVQVFIYSLAEWQPLSWKALVDALESSEKKQKFRFKLRWGQNPSRKCHSS